MTAHLIHNPTAGEGELGKEELVELLANEKLRCRYSSTKEDGWKEEMEKEADLVVVAGGDGTVRKVVKQLLKRSVLDKELPIVLLPMGTANNVAKTLNLQISPKKIIRQIHTAETRKVDIGCIMNIEEENFFLESFGYGIFPYLMQVMKRKEVVFSSAEAELEGALKELHRILIEYEPRECELEIDGTDHSGKFILAEIMNTRSIGPNLTLAPHSDPGDGELEVILVPENQKQKFADYIAALIRGSHQTYRFHTLLGKDISISWDGSHVHIDDKVVKLEKNREVSIKIKPGVLSFLVPPHV